MSPVPRRRAPGRRRWRRRLGRHLPGRDRSRPLPLGGTLDLAITLERARRLRGRVVVQHGLGRRGSGGRSRPRHDPLELGGHGGPDDAEQLVTSRRDFFPARQAGMLSFRFSGHPAPPTRQGAPLTEGLPMAFVGRGLPLIPAAASQSGRLGRATDPGFRLPVDLIENRPLCRRGLLTAAEPRRGRDDGVGSRGGVASPPRGRPGGGDQLAGQVPLLRFALGRGGSRSPPVAASETILMPRRA